MLDFAEIKQIPIVAVLNRYRVQIRFAGNSATAPCPLPTHKQGDRERTFSVKMDENYWQCFSQSCRAGGKRGGDVIDLVALMENCRPREAAEKLAEWHGIKGAPHIEERRVQSHASIKGYRNGNPKSDSGQNYMALVEAWYHELTTRQNGEGEDDFEKRVLNGIKSKLVESYRNGKTSLMSPCPVCGKPREVRPYCPQHE